MNFKIKTETDRSRVIGLISSLDIREKTYKGRIEPIRNLRSVNQNNYYWFLMNIISGNTGYEEKELHKIFKTKFLSEVDVTGFDVEVIKTGSTATKKTTEFINYLDKIKQFAAQELDIVLPEPNETL